MPSKAGPGPAPETSPPGAQQSSPPAAASGISTGAIAGIVIGACALLVLGAILVVVLRRRKVAAEPAPPEYGAGPYVPELAGSMTETVSVRKDPVRVELM